MLIWTTCAISIGEPCVGVHVRFFRFGGNGKERTNRGFMILQMQGMKRKVNPPLAMW